MLLVQRCLKGDRAATIELVKQFENEVIGFCIRLLRNRHDAEDVAQDVFLRIFRSLHRWDQSRPLKPWILAITVNRCRTAMAKRAKRPTTAGYLADLPDQGLPTPDQELSRAIAHCVADLRQEYREVFVLYHETGRSYEEIGELLDRPVGTVKTWLHRARNLLAKQLEALGHLQPETLKHE